MSTNLIPFPTASATVRDVEEAFPRAPESHSHAVQFYESEAFLSGAVGQFLTAGLRDGDALIVIATEPHREHFVRQLDEAGGARAIANGQMMLLDAHETLSRFMVGDMPDPDLFRDFIDGAIGKTRQARARARVRAYGEMVDILWKEGNSRAAIRLEELWNVACKEHSFSLLCAYVMGNFYKEGDASHFMEVCRNHTHVVPTESFIHLDDPRARLREISLLQQRALALESEIQHRKELETALRDALRERGRVEEELRASVRREKEARERAEASDAFKEIFLGILGHDLRNPLNTVLTTARLMQLRGGVGSGNDRRIDRIVSSGTRMERMIEQLLDVARARLAEGIPITRTPAQNLAPLVAKIVDEARAGNPAREVEIHAGGPCTADVDPDRFEQVVSNLVGNAITHGDAARPITITIAGGNGVASIAVHNFGVPIEPTLMPVLFDPFKRGDQSMGRVDGLGLGLYIVERIVSAHGGNIRVESSLEAGTLFEVVIPSSAGD